MGPVEKYFPPYILNENNPSWIAQHAVGVFNLEKDMP